MNRRNGLLAFLCTLIAVAALGVQVPFLSGTQLLSKAAEATTLPHRSDRLAKIFTPPTAPQIPTDSSGKPVVTLFQVQREQRADKELEKLASQSGIPFFVLKAYLALWSKGTVDEQGFFWGSIPGEKTEAVTDDKDSGRRSTTVMVRHLGKLAHQTSSYLAAIIAPVIGTPRATRTARFSEKNTESFLRAMDISLLAFQRYDAEQTLCDVLGLAAALNAVWPVSDRDILTRQGQGVALAASPGEKIHAPMSGLVTFAGNNQEGVCVEINTACDMRTTICNMKSSLVNSGQHVQRATIIGTSGALRPVYNVFVGSVAVDSTQFLPPAKEQSHQPPPVQPKVAPADPAEEAQITGDQGS